MSILDNVEQQRIINDQARQIEELQKTAIWWSDEWRNMQGQRDWWAGVARGFARQRTVARLTMRVLGGGLRMRQRRIDDLRRTIDAMLPDDPSGAVTKT